MKETTATEKLSQVLDTIPKLLLDHAKKRADRPANRLKDLGIWQTWTWSEVADEVRNLACGLAKIGFQRGDKLAVIGDNRPRLYWSMVAVQARRNSSSALSGLRCRGDGICAGKCRR